jgi:hypothetical protein
MRNTLLLVVVLLLLSVALSGCAQYTTIDIIKKAEKVCATNDGINYVLMDVPFQSRIYCTNGAVFRVK